MREEVQMTYEVKVTDGWSAISWTVLSTESLGEAVARVDSERARIKREKRSHTEVAGVWDNSRDEWVDEDEAAAWDFDAPSYYGQLDVIRRIIRQGGC